MSPRWSGLRRARTVADAELVGVVQRLLGPPEKWAVYRVPGEADLPDPAASRESRERWWRTHVAAVAEALLLTDPDADRRAVLAARDLLTACAVLREQEAGAPPVVAVALPVGARTGLPEMDYRDTALRTVQDLTEWCRPTGPATG